MQEQKCTQWGEKNTREMTQHRYAAVPGSHPGFQILGLEKFLVVHNYI